MPDLAHYRDVNGTAPEYAAWRGELLAELALSRLSRHLKLQLYKPEQHQDYDFLVATATGLCVFVDVRAFSSMALKIKSPEKIELLRCKIPVKQIERARRSRSPVLLFLFDADTDHGRFVRLDTLPKTRDKATAQSLFLPKENEIGEQRLRRLMEELESSANRKSA